MFLAMTNSIIHSSKNIDIYEHLSNMQFCFILQLTQFQSLLDHYFDVTAEDAIDVIMADSKKTLEARTEDAEFVRRLRRNEYVAFGARDWDQQGRFDRALERQEKQAGRVENERKRKLVSMNQYQTMRRKKTFLMI